MLRLFEKHIIIINSMLEEEIFVIYFWELLNNSDIIYRTHAELCTFLLFQSQNFSGSRLLNKMWRFVLCRGYSFCIGVNHGHMINGCMVKRHTQVFFWQSRKQHKCHMLSIHVMFLFYFFL